MAYGDADYGPLRTQTVTIANNGTVSTVLDLGAGTFLALLMPAAFTGTAITFQACLTRDGTFVAVKDDAGADVSIVVAAARWVGLSSANMAKLAALRYLKLVSGSAEGGARSIEVVMK